MTQKIILPLNGAMNKDVAPAYIKSEQGEVVERRNARVVSMNGKTGYNTSLKGTSVLGSYTNHLAVGSVTDTKRDRVLFFLKDNTSNLDKIISVVRPKLNSTSHTITTLFQSSVFNFNEAYPVSADIIDDYLVFTDNVNAPRKLYIGTGSQLLSSADLDVDNIQLAVRPPSSAPTIQFGTDTSRKVNLMTGKSWQFAYQYVYVGYEYSVLSAYSKIAVSPSIFSANYQTYIDNNIGNFVTVGVDLGSDEVKTVKIYARENNVGNWFLIEEYNKTTEAEYTPYAISFYNDKARRYVSTSEALSFYSDVPLLASTVLGVKNRVVLGGITKGYDVEDISIDVAYEVTYNDVNLSSTAGDLNNGNGSSSSTSMFIGWDIPAVVNEGDTFTVKLERASFTVRYISTSFVYRRIDVGYNFSYLAKAGDTQTDVINAFYNDITSKGISILKVNPSTITGITVSGALGVGGFDVGIEFLNIKSFFAGYTITYTDGDSVYLTAALAQGTNTFKAGSYYNVGIVVYDAFGRPSGVVNEQRVYIPSNGERAYADAYKQASISFNINENNTTLPSWAAYYRFVVSESVNIQSVFPFVSGTRSGGNVFGIYIDNKKVIAINIPTNVAYQFIKGDYLIIEKDNGVDTITTTIKTVMDVRDSIRAYRNTAAPEDPVVLEWADTSGYWLIVPQGDTSITEFEDSLMYIYRPKSETEETIYYEDYRTYNILNQVPLTLDGVVGDGDAWFVERSYQWDEDSDPKTNQVVEDFFVTVDDSLRAYSKGRPIVAFDDLGKQQEFQQVVWSKQYLDNTKINGLAFFESLSRIELDEKNGAISGLELVGDVIKVIQPVKETSLYVGKQQITNADGALSLVSTANFIGTVYPLNKESGSRYKKSIVSNDSALYYWDGKRGEVLRSAGNEPFALSSKGMSSYFYYLKLQLEGAYWSDVVFHFDKRYNELICTFNWQKVNNGVYNSVTLVYSEDVGGWTYFYDLYNSLTGVNIGTDVFGRIGEANYGFSGSVLYELDANASNNVLYGSVKTLSIESNMNVSPAQEKCLKAVQLDSNKALHTYFESDVANTRPLGNYTYLVPASYRNREGLFASQINRNIRTSSGANSTLLYSGNLMTGKNFKVTLTNGDSTETEVRFIHIGFVPSN